MLRTVFWRVDRIGRRTCGDLARSLNGLAVAATLAGCSGPPTDPTQILSELLPQAAPFCTAAFNSGQSATTPAPGSVIGPAVAFRALDERYGYGTEWQTYGTGPPVPWEHATATAADEVRAVVCIRQGYDVVGSYQSSDAPLTADIGSGVPAVRSDWDIQVIRWPSGEPVAAKFFQAADPPAKVEGLPATAKHWSGPVAMEETKAWLEAMLAD